MKKRWTSLIVIAAMTAALLSWGPVYADQSSQKATGDTRLDQYVNGYIPVYKEGYKVRSAGKHQLDDDESGQTEKHPASYCTRKVPSAGDASWAQGQPWAENVKVKDQIHSSLCWAFSMTTIAEYSYAKELYEKTGELYSGEMSPGHIAQFYYNRLMDPLENTEGDANDIPNATHYTLYGGNVIFGMQHLATWSGPVSESAAPFDETHKHIRAINGDFDWDGYKLPYSGSLAYGHNELTLEESIVHMKPSKDIIKDLISRYGSCSASMEFDYRTYMNINDASGQPNEVVGEGTADEKKYLGGLSYYNYNDKFSANHAITIIGWDDTYKKENFGSRVILKDDKGKPILDENGNIQYKKDEHGNEIRVQPENDGAWIIQNSWGDKVHDGGLFYASYETADFTGSARDVFAFDMQPADTYDYNFQYDGNAVSSDSSDRAEDNKHRPYYTQTGTRAANIYTNTTGHTISLEAVGYTTYNLGLTEYDVSVYTGLTDPKDPMSGTLRGTSRISSTTPGCKTGKLDQPVKVKPGETYSIVFYFRDTTAFGTEVETSSPHFIFYAQNDPGQSFFKPAASSKPWVDMDNYDACFRIKGFANVCPDEPKPSPQPEAPVNVSGIPLATMKSQGQTKLSVSWEQMQGVDGYDIFFGKCNSHKSKKDPCALVASVKAGGACQWTKTGLAKTSAYMTYVKGYVIRGGKKTYVGTGPTVHAYTGRGTRKFTNAKSVTAKKSVKVKKGRTYRIRAKVKKQKRGRLMPKKHAATLRYLSTDKSVATVNKKGKIKGVKKGVCYVYAYAHNGVYKKVKVTVK